MSNNSTDKGFWKELKESFNEGYRKEEEKKDKSKPFKDQVIDGVAKGTAESLNPWRWITKIFK
jgi:hypothetical protein